jgi:diaminopimelate epimerase
MPLELDIVRADPAGNITIFVLNRIDDPAFRLRAAKALLAEPSLKAEQIGFVIPPGRPAADPLTRPAGAAGGRPSAPAAEGRLWRREMMGGEFCGNAARSFGLYAARQGGLSGKRDICIEISGAPAPVPVHLDLDASTAEAEIPGPLAAGTLAFEGRPFPAYFFEGITHVIAEGLEPDRGLVLGLLEAARRAGPPRPAGHPADTRHLLDARHPFDACHPLDACHLLDALGVMFYDPARRFMRPAVYVAATESLVFESSCGSGTAALAAYLAGGLAGGGRWEIAQPGGLIEARVKKQAGKIETIGIGGPVSLGEPCRFSVF